MPPTPPPSNNPSGSARRSAIPSRTNTGRSGGGIEGMLSGLSDLLKTLGELAEKGQEFKNTVGENASSGNPGKDVKFHYGFSIKTMNNGSELKVEPFGNQFKRDENTGDATVDEIREPMADVLEESDHTLVVLEMPGVGPDDVKLDLQGDVLTITAERRGKRYRKEVLLPGENAVYDLATLAVTCNNGVVEIRCPRR
ncbi:MAG: Hsp20/alpha crystallin family protein [Planctomycetaceae bacterium]|jgi:HSP20 family protein|nr:Hsp20/alpha crystallin family protein [Phycisphaerales bacterium]MCE2653034.1 Hsp20/alpha crystallin family protein [Planctomycetaceae bacterium]